jgi:hypothetical protein
VRTEEVSLKVMRRELKNPTTKRYFFQPRPVHGASSIGRVPFCFSVLSRGLGLNALQMKDR